MGGSRGQKLSGMQKQVLSLYRGFLRAARSKSEEERCKIESIVCQEFRRNSKEVDRKNFQYVEYLLRRGHKQLDQLRNPGEMAPRWKGKDTKSKKNAEAEALKEPMSKIISQLQTSLVQSNACGFLSDSCVHLAVQAEQLDLLDKACFGRPVRNVEKDMYWFQLSLEEAFYLCYSLKCLKINGGADANPLNDEELWCYLKSKKEAFPVFYKAYSHLRMKNWVVRSGAQYGVDFIVYRHHPARVHSEYGVLVLSHDNDDDLDGRLRVWSDVHCTTRLLGSVAKTLLVLYVNKNGHSGESPLCLENCTIEERTISRWSPEQCRERSI